MMRKIFNFVSIIMLLWTIISGAYLALPEEYKALIPQFNWLTALISGGSTGVLGGSMIIVKNFMKKNKDENDARYLQLAQEVLTIKEEHINLKNAVNNNTDTQKETNRLIRIDLESKLSNPLVEDFIKEKIRGEGIGNKD